MKKILNRAYWQVWFFLGNTAGMHFIFKRTYIRRWKTKDKSPLGKYNYDINARTGLVWEGFPGSGNSTSGRALIKSIGDRFAVTNHTHSANIALEGLKQDKPVAILIRYPIDCIDSMTRRWPFLDAGQCLDWYCRFYLRLLPKQEDLLVVKFETVVKDFEKVVNSLNVRFNLSLAEDIDPRSEWRTGQKNREMPDEDKIRLLNEKDKRQQLILNLHGEKLERANKVYLQFVNNAI